ncbi:MAG: hypothetical protein ACLRT4_05140 [Thomasclavelia sp.]
MEYIFEETLSSLKDLKHIEWFLNHRSQYEFITVESQNLLNSLLDKITKKNIFYSDIINEYNQLVKIFENNPFNYQYDVLENNNAVASKHTTNYFIKISDKDKRQYIVAYQYLLDNPVEYNLDKMKEKFNKKLLQDRQVVNDNFEAVDQHYKRYWQGDVCNAMGRYQQVGYGKDYHLVKKVIYFLIYNFLLIRIIHETQFINVVTHFWQYFSDSYDVLYSANYVFFGFKYLGILALVLTAYFIYLDVYYIYGLYYLFFVKRKFDNVYHHHQDTLKYYQQFLDDWKRCKQGGLSNKLEKFRHRNSTYLPLIEKSSYHYNFHQSKLVKEDGKTINRPVIINEKVPKAKFYKSPVERQWIKLVLLLIFVEAICNTASIIQYLQ